MPNLRKTVPVEGKGTFSADGKWSLLVESLLLSFSEIKTKLFVSVTGKGVPNICQLQHFHYAVIKTPSVCLQSCYWCWKFLKIHHAEDKMICNTQENLAKGASVHKTCISDRLTTTFI